MDRGRTDYAPATHHTARPQPASGKATTQRPREYVTHMFRACARVSLVPPLQYARKDGPPRRRAGGRETVGQRRRHCAGGVASPVKRSARGNFPIKALATAEPWRTLTAQLIPT